jgi:hypothetical protein
VWAGRWKLSWKLVVLSLSFSCSARMWPMDESASLPFAQPHVDPHHSPTSSLSWMPLDVPIRLSS